MISELSYKLLAYLDVIIGAYEAKWVSCKVKRAIMSLAEYQE